MDEQAVLITPDGLGRLAIVRRDDGLFCLYEHWRWSAATLEAFGAKGSAPERWTDGPYDRLALYEPSDHIRPLPGVYGSVLDAEREARSRRGFEHAAPEVIVPDS